MSAARLPNTGGWRSIYFSITCRNDETEGRFRPRGGQAFYSP